MIQQKKLMKIGYAELKVRGQKNPFNRWSSMSRLVAPLSFTS